MSAALRRNPLRLFAAVLAMLGCCSVAQAHKASDAYLQLDARREGLQLRWDIALRDLNAAVDIDTDDDGQLTWREVRSAWPRISAYALARIAIDNCTLQQQSQSLEQRGDGTYAVLMLSSACQLPDPAVIHYSLLREIDPTHRGIAKIERPGEPVMLRLLDPGQAPAMPAARASAGPAMPGAGIAPSDRGAFVREGVWHILTGYDHVLFLLCLLLPAVLRRTPQGWRPAATRREALWPVLGIVSAFTLAHSITLALAALHWVSLPSSFIEPAIAVTIVLAALDNLRPVFPARRALVTFCFGLIHGFGFAGVLAELQLPPAQFIWALLQFNVGLELGQLLIVASATTALFALRQRPQYRIVVLGGGSVAALAIALLWVIERSAHVALLPL